MRTKNIALVALAALVLAACGDPIPPAEWKQGEVSLKTVAGFEDCTMVKVRFHENGWPLMLVRCPLSQVSINQSVQQGKTTVNQTTAVIEQADAERKAKIEALRANVEKLQADLEALSK